jgi:hypothetical protein
MADSLFPPRKPFVNSRPVRLVVVRRPPDTGIEKPMNELEQVSESLALRSFGYSPAASAEEWRETPLMGGFDRLLREIGTYLEFVAIARSG